VLAFSSVNRTNVSKVQLLVRPHSRHFFSVIPGVTTDLGGKLLVAKRVLNITVEALFIGIRVLNNLGVSLLGELRLPASGRGANRITVELDILDHPLMLGDTFGGAEMRGSTLHIIVEIGGKVIHGIFSNIVPFGF